MIEAERELNASEIGRKVTAASLYFRYKAEKRTDEATRQQIVLDMEDYLKSQLDLDVNYKQIKNLVEALKDASNSAASRLKTTDN